MKDYARFRTTIVELQVPFVHPEGDLVLPGTRGRLMGWRSDADAERATDGKLAEAYVIVSWQTYMFPDACAFLENDRPYHATQFFNPDEEGYLAEVPLTSLRVVGMGPTIEPPRKER